ncbi:hypothetical protein P0Y35_14160 [Kiritimatiellaeota bacterium B1221]|nr:hypothetical protein [Kiritimatiellaeota bacterium B1221]
MKSLSKHKSGSALLLTLLVVSLLMVIVLSFTVYVRMEFRTVSNRMESLQSRQNAKLALYLALAQLQKSAGADQRVTANAEILGASVPQLNRHLTGVWDTENPGDDPIWLISSPPGNAVDPLTPPNTANSIALVDTGVLGSTADLNDRIFAQLIEIDTDNAPGNYAWWVADEGVKASLSLNDPFESTTDIDTLTSTELSRLRYGVPVRNAQETAITPTTDFENTAANDFFGSVVNLDQYPFYANLDNPRENGGIHHYTHRATGLLTQPLTGGVKKDLSLAPDLLGTGFEEYMDFTAYLEEPSSSHPVIKNADDLRRAHHITPPTTLSPANGEIVHSVTPIITDFGLQFSPRRASSSDGEASLMMAVALELWNPYTTALEQEDLILEISGFQDFDMTLRDASDTVVWSDNFDPNSIFGNTISIRLGQEQFHSATYVFLENGAYDMELHGPGRLLYWTGPDQDEPTKASFANRRSNQSRLQQVISPAITFPILTGSGDYSVGYTMDETNLTVRLRRAPENGGEVLVEHSNLLFDDVDNIDHGTLGQWQNRWLTYQFRLIERGTTYGGDRSAWLKNIDKRTPNPRFGYDITTDTHTIREGASTAPDDSALKNNLSVDQDETLYYFDRTLSNSDWSRDTRRDIPLFELPRQPLISVGQLQHLYIHGMPPYSIGNPWGGSTWNQLFDDYFLSGIQRDISEPDFSTTAYPQLPHPRLELADPQDLGLAAYDNNTLSTLDEDSALALKVRGQFNLNSVSTQAWKAVLAGCRFANFSHQLRDTNLQDASHSNVQIDTGNDYPAGFTRFPQSIQELFQVDNINFDTTYDSLVLNLKPGITFLFDRTSFNEDDSDYDTSDESKLDDMAEEIVDAIQQRMQNVGRPYFTLNEFLTEPYQNGDPILEHAIETTGLRRKATPSGDITPEERTPSWLSQADVISALAPFLSTRSDTFTIRAYGNVEAPNGDISSQAWCEATVQRIITPVESGLTLNEMADPLDSAFGRQFKIISFKWLSKSEI